MERKKRRRKEEERDPLYLFLNLFCSSV